MNTECSCTIPSTGPGFGGRCMNCARPIPPHVLAGYPSTGDYTLSSGGAYARYTQDHRLLDTSEPAVNWALNWANTDG